MDHQPAALIVLVGLPAAGKSTFAQTFSASVAKHGIQCVQIEYDSLIPVEKQRTLAALEVSVDWKTERKTIVKRVADYFQGSEVPQFSPSIIDRTKRVFVIIDDNNYYSSMRYEYFQLARTLQIGFCQLFLDVSLEASKGANLSRDDSSKVPDIVIENMAAKMEPPNPEKNSWERFSLSLPVVEWNFKDCVEKLSSLACLASENPPQPLVSNGDSLADPCSESLIHEIDKLLRKFVGSKMKEYSRSCPSKDALLKKASTLKQVKDKLFQDVKSGRTPVPCEIREDHQLLENFIFDFCHEAIYSQEQII